MSYHLRKILPLVNTPFATADRNITVNTKAVDQAKQLARAAMRQLK